MNRRTFTQAMGAAALAAVAPSLPAEALAGSGSTDSAKEPPFPLSVMLWTVFNDLPFEERLAKVAERVTAMSSWWANTASGPKPTFPAQTTARKRLGIRFDATAGLEHAGHTKVSPTLANCDAFVAELKQALTPMESAVVPRHDRPFG